MGDSFIQLGSSGFMQFGSEPPVPVTNIQWVEPPPSTVDNGSGFRLRDAMTIDIPLPPGAAQQICRLAGLPQIADRIEIAEHPGLAELNLQLDRYYSDTPQEPES